MTTTNTLTQLDSDAAVIAELAEQAAGREVVEIADDLAVIVRNHDQVVVEFDLEQHRDHPRRKTGKVTLTDVDSFVAYVARYSLERATTIWADLDNSRIVAVLDDHAAHADAETEGDANWGQHRATLQLKHTEDWDHWLGQDGEYLNQSSFAEHIEDGVDAITEPEPATMLEVAQSFHATTGASFNSTRRLSGDIEFSYSENATARAGENGTLEVPQKFELGLSPFEGTDRYKIEARFRYRVGNGNASLGYRLIRPDRALRAAFNDIVTDVSSGTGLTVLAGTPRT